MELIENKWTVDEAKVETPVRMRHSDGGVISREDTTTEVSGFALISLDSDELSEVYEDGPRAFESEIREMVSRNADVPFIPELDFSLQTDSHPMLRVEGWGPEPV